MCGKHLNFTKFGSCQGKVKELPERGRGRILKVLLYINFLLWPPLPVFLSIIMYRVGHKNVALYFCPYLCQIMTDFPNSDTLFVQFAIM